LRPFIGDLLTKIYCPSDFCPYPPMMATGWLLATGSVTGMTLALWRLVPPKVRDWNNIAAASVLSLLFWLFFVGETTLLATHAHLVWIGVSYLVSLYAFLIGFGMAIVFGGRRGSARQIALRRVRVFGAYQAVVLTAAGLLVKYF
jgi:ABC-type transport system involved in multi-copper enzyme maturation permease subunit